jgi:hypothetical protein
MGLIDPFPPVANDSFRVLDLQDECFIGLDSFTKS